MSALQLAFIETSVHGEEYHDKARAKNNGAGSPGVPNRSPEWEFITRMSESRFRCAIFLIDEAKSVEGKGARPDALIAHKRQLWYGQPVACWDVIATRRGIWNHDRARSAYCIEWLASVYDIRISCFSHLSCREHRMTYGSDLDLGGQSPSRSCRDKASLDSRNRTTRLCTPRLQL